MTGRVERVSDELARALLPCPLCHVGPEIYRRATLRGAQSAVSCPCDQHEWKRGKDCLYPTNLVWCDSLYEAVARWQSIAALSGSHEIDCEDVPF